MVSSIDHTVPTDTKPARVRIQRRVELADTDSTGHYHHSSVIRWVEAAETVLYQRIGLDGLPVLPRVQYQVDYRERLWRNELVDIELSVLTVGRSSVMYGFNVARAEQICAAGSMTVVLTQPENGRSTPLSDSMRDAFLCSGVQNPELLGFRPLDSVYPSNDNWGIGYG